MNVRLKNGWQQKKLADVATVSFSTVNKKSEAGQRQVLLCNYMDVWKNSRIRHGLDFMQSTASDGEIERFRLRRGDVLITKDSETREEIAQPSVVEDIPADLVLGYHLALIRPNPNQAHGPFLAAQLAVPQFRSQFVRAAAGATRYGLKLESVESAIVTIPSLAEQRRIAEILNAVDAAIDATRAVIAQTRRLKTALIDDLLTHGMPGRHRHFKQQKYLGRLPSAWDILPIGQLFHVQLGKMLSKASKTGKFYRPYLGNRNVQWGRLDLECVEMMDFNPDESQKFKLEPGDILVCEGGEVGRTAIWRNEIEDCCFQKALHRLRPCKANHILPEFFMYFMQYGTANNVFRRFTGQTSIGHLTRETMIKIMMPVPSLDEQIAMMGVVEAVERRACTEDAILDRLEGVKSALCHTLLTGQMLPDRRGKS